MKKSVTKTKYQLVFDNDTKQVKVMGTDISTVYVPDTCTHFEGTKLACENKITDLNLVYDRNE